MFDFYSCSVVIGSFYKIFKLKIDNDIIKLLNYFVVASIISLTGLPILDVIRNYYNYFRHFCPENQKGGPHISKICGEDQIKQARR